MKNSFRFNFENYFWIYKKTNIIKNESDETSYLNRLIEDVQFSVRTLNCLKSENIRLCGIGTSIHFGQFFNPEAIQSGSNCQHHDLHNQVISAIIKT